MPSLPLDFPWVPGRARSPRTHAFTVNGSSLGGSELDVRLRLVGAVAITLSRYFHSEISLLQVAEVTTVSAEGGTSDRFGEHPEHEEALSIARSGARSISIHVDETAPVRALIAQIDGLLAAAQPVRSTELQLTLLSGSDGSIDQVFEVLQLGSDADGPDVHLIAQRRGSDWDCVLQYDGELYRPETLARFAEHVAVLTCGMATSEVSIAQLAMFEGAGAQLAVAWRGRAVERERVTVLDLFARQVRARPWAPAVTFGGETLSYAELELRVQRLAHYLQTRVGVESGSRVAVCVTPSFDMVVCPLALWLLGAVYVPLDPSYPAERLGWILDDTSPWIVLTQTTVAGRLPTSGARRVALDAALVREAIDSCVGEVRPLETDDQSTAYVIYTSGTTGRPKGVMVSHANLVHFVQVAQARYAFTEGDAFVALARYTFSITMFEVLGPLVGGGRLVVLDRDHVLDFPRLIDTLRTITVLHASPSLLRKLLAYLRDHAIDPAVLRGLRHVSSGGDTVSAQLIESLKAVFPAAELFVIYGCSEISCMGCTYEVPRDRTVIRNYVGRAFDNVAVRLYDSRRNLVPTGVVGEVYFAGAGVTQGYLGREELTRERFVEIDGERWYRTGDLGRFDAEGQLELLGREDFQIKVRGMRVELGDVEANLLQVVGVREGIVALREIGGEDKLVAYVVLHTDATTTLSEIQRSLRAKLPDYMIPAAFMVLDAMPVNVNQKVDRKALPTPTASDLAKRGPVTSPRNEQERELVVIWERILNVRPIGIHDAFFEVGGDSLLAVDIMIEIERVFQRTLPVSTLLTEPTIAELAVLLDTRDAEPPSIVLLRPGRAGIPVFFIHDGDGEVIPYRNLALHLDAEHPVYGVCPRSRGEFPMLHTRLTEIVDEYVEQIRNTHTTGPYIVGGLCIGGFIAFEVARRLREQGQEVPLVVLLDVAHVKAQPVSLVNQRITRFRQSIHPDSEPRSSWQTFAHLVETTARKGSRLVSYEVTSRSRRLHNQSRILALRWCLDHGREHALPYALRGISVDSILRFAEQEYSVPEPYSGEVVLCRATEKDPSFEGTPINDTPYRDLFVDPLLGWEGRARTFSVHDAAGGHSSMLQEPRVRDLAAFVQQRITGALTRTSPPVRVQSSSSLLVVVVNYRCAPLTIACLRSLESEVRDLGNVRVVVVDNASGDGSAEAIASAIATLGFGDWARLVAAECNGGYASGNNLAIRDALASDEPPSYVHLLNPDTEVRAGGLRALVEFMDSHPKVGIGGSGLENPDGSRWSTAFRFPTVASELERGLRLGIASKLLHRWTVARAMGDRPEPVDWLPGASMIIRREVFEAIGLLDEQYFLYYEETDFCWQAKRAGWACWYIPKSRVMHIAGQSTGVTARDGVVRRRPQYVHDSRRRYFVKNHGLAYAALADLAWSGGLVSWKVRRVLQRKPVDDPPYLLRDSVKNSVFVQWRSSRSDVKAVL